MKEVNEGDKVKVEYVGKLEDGTVFDSSENHEEPLEFTVGSGRVIKGFEDAVVGMNVGEEKEVTVSPEQGYGTHKDELVKEMPREAFSAEGDIKEGMVFRMKLQDGRQIPVKISDVSENTVTIDLNPPLAGKKLFFTIKVLDILE
ncbi:MAG: peptidylprolyl isomerase [Candidatus Thermoplasmatota archaeon]